VGEYKEIKEKYLVIIYMFLLTSATFFGMALVKQKTPELFTKILGPDLGPALLIALIVLTSYLLSCGGAILVDHLGKEDHKTEHVYKYLKQKTKQTTL